MHKYQIAPLLCEKRIDDIRILCDISRFCWPNAPLIQASVTRFVPKLKLKNIWNVAASARLKGSIVTANR